MKKLFLKYYLRLIWCLASVLYHHWKKFATLAIPDEPHYLYHNGKEFYIRREINEPWL